MITTNYGELRTAYVALVNLSREGLKIPLSAVLKWKRIRGVMQPLVEQFDEMSAELVREYSEKDAEGKPIQGDQPGTVRIADVAGYNKAIQEALETEVTVGCDYVTAADFGEPDVLVSSTLAEHLANLGPFFKDEGEGSDAN